MVGREAADQRDLELALRLQQLLLAHRLLLQPLDLREEELFDAVLILAGGLLLLTPGLVTVLVGLSALVPGTRRVLKGYLKRAVSRRLPTGAVRVEQRW